MNVQLRILEGTVVRHLGSPDCVGTVQAFRPFLHARWAGDGDYIVRWQSGETSRAGESSLEALEHDPR